MESVQNKENKAYRISIQAIEKNQTSTLQT